MKIMEVDRRSILFEIADMEARLRTSHNIKTQDAIILATGIAENMDCFFTNGLRLKNIYDRTGIRTVVIADL